MCCRYYILPKGVEWDPIREGAESAGLMRRFREAGLELKSAGELRPADVAPVLATDRGGGQSVFPMRWGFRLNGAGRTTLLINARVESAAQKPCFREAWRAHRCAVPASWYFEWQQSPERNGTKTKYAIRDEAAPILWLCGLYRIEEGLPVFVVLTRAPGPRLAEIHDRMPLILPAESIRRWVDPAVRPETRLSGALLELQAEKAG